MHNIRVDIPTLNSQPGRIYDIDQQPALLAAIDDAEIFFNELLADDIITVITGISRPSAIGATVMEYLASVDEDPHALTLVVVDSTDHLSPESDGYHTIQGGELDHKFNNVVYQLVKEQHVHAVVIAPAYGAVSRFAKENEPSFRQLGIYGKHCDKGVVLYNPIAENNINYLRGSITDYDCYISEKGLNTLRFWHVVKNTDGIESVSERLLFLPGTSYMIEVGINQLIDSFNVVKDKIYDVGLNCFYKNPKSQDSPDHETE